MRDPRDQLALELNAAPPRADHDQGPAPTDHESQDPSDEQKAVLRFETDLVVAAGAGSGKTRVLVDLYVEILQRPELVGASADEIGPGRILCLTFTERAARQIQGRIRGRIDRKDWLRQLETAPIQTFHGWCARLLRDHPLEAGVDPRFTVLSEEASDDLLQRVALETLRRGLEEGDEPCWRVVELFGLGGAARRLAELVRRIRTAGWPASRPIERFEERVARASEEADGPLRVDLDRAAGTLAGEMHRMATTPDRRKQWRHLERALAQWRAEPSFERGETLRSAIQGARGAKVARKLALEAFDPWWSARVEVDRAKEIGVWPSLAVTVRDGYRAARVVRGALDYDDLLLRTRELLLAYEEIRSAYRRRYLAVLVDEHQDTDPVQHAILELIVGAECLSGRRRGGDPRWCVVGDVQQAIYGFRGASVSEFAELVDGAEERGALRRLVTNHRSRSELVAFHNAFFPRVLIAGSHADTVAYTAQKADRLPTGGIAVEVLAPQAERSAAEGRELEARALAARLQAALDPGHPDSVAVLDEKLREWRPAHPGDAVILFRRLTQVEPYRRALQAAGLAPIVVGSGEFYARQEVFDVLNALEAALVPEDPIPLVAFLRSPMVGLPDDAVWRLTRGWERDAVMLRDHMVGAVEASGLDAEERILFPEACGVLDELRARADIEPPGALLGWLVDRTGYTAVLDSLPDRAQRRANLARLVALADGAPSEGAPLLADWVALLRARADHPPRERDAPLPRPADRIMIMSIHQAKGLEFPIVALADLGGTGREGLGGVAFDPELGVVAKWWKDGATEGAPTRSYALAKVSARRREEAEEARLLYVAATRACDHLILSGGARGSRVGSWLTTTLEFLEQEAATDLVRPLALEAWGERHEASILEPEEAVAGQPYRQPLPSLPGELPARELAAVLVGGAGASLPAVARQAMRSRMRRGERAHRALERLPLRPPAPFDLRSWLAAAGVADDDLESLAAFVEREAWPRLGAASEVLRELPFRLRLPPPAGTVVGAIDCLWRDADGAWWVWDYKLVSDAAPESLHEAQLGIYALAAAAAIGLDEVRGAVWYLERGVAKEMRWDRTALAELEDRLVPAFPRGEASSVEDRV